MPGKCPGNIQTKGLTLVRQRDRTEAEEQIKGDFSSRNVLNCYNKYAFIDNFIILIYFKKLLKIAPEFPKFHCILFYVK